MLSFWFWSSTDLLKCYLTSSLSGAHSMDSELEAYSHWPIGTDAVAPGQGPGDLCSARDFFLSFCIMERFRDPLKGPHGQGMLVWKVTQDSGCLSMGAE